MKIALNDKIGLDLAKLIVSRLLAVANSGGGKSWLIRRIVEQAFGKVQIIILDPEGEFSTLREKFDFILCGKGMDAPAESRSAALLARKLLESKSSAIIDLYELHPQDRKHFVKLFLTSMINAPKELYNDCLIILDEAHRFAPEKEEAESLSAVIEMASLGRKRGFCLIPVTQRVSKLSKDVAAECNNKLMGRASLDLDRKRTADELGIRDRDEILALRNLEPGEFFAFGPAISNEVIKLRVGPVQTSMPKAGSQTHVAPPSAKVKKELAALADLPAEAEEEARTIAEYKAEVTRLKRELAVKPVQKDVLTKIERIKIPAVGKKALVGIKAAETSMRKLVKTAKDLLPGVESALDKLGAEVSRINDIQIAQPAVRASVAPVVAVHHALRAAAAPAIPNDAALTVPKQRILDALAWLENLNITQAEKSQLAVLADQSPRSSGYTNNLGSLRTAGFIIYPTGGFVALTDTGRALATAPSAPLTSDDIHDSIRRKVTRPQWAILQVLIDVHPADISKDELAPRAGQSATSSGYTNNLGALRSLGFLDYPSSGRVRARDILFA